MLLHQEIDIQSTVLELKKGNHPWGYAIASFKAQFQKFIDCSTALKSGLAGIPSKVSTLLSDNHKEVKIIMLLNKVRESLVFRSFEALKNISAESFYSIILGHFTLLGDLTSPNAITLRRQAKQLEEYHDELEAAFEAAGEQRVVTEPLKNLLYTLPVLGESMNQLYRLPELINSLCRDYQIDSKTLLNQYMPRVEEVDEFNVDKMPKPFNERWIEILKTVDSELLALSNYKRILQEAMLMLTEEHSNSLNLAHYKNDFLNSLKNALIEVDTLYFDSNKANPLKNIRMARRCFVSLSLKDKIPDRKTHLHLCIKLLRLCDAIKIVAPYHSDLPLFEDEKKFLELEALTNLELDDPNPSDIQWVKITTQNLRDVFDVSQPKLRKMIIEGEIIQRSDSTKRTKYIDPACIPEPKLVLFYRYGKKLEAK